MSTKEKLKHARTMKEILFILNMPEYLPLFEKADILQASALRLLREADLKYIGIDSSGRQKLLKAVRYLSKNIPLTVDERTRGYAMNMDPRYQSKYPRFNEGRFCLQKAQDELLRCKMELNLKRIELARIRKQTKLIHEIFEMTANAKQHIQELQKNCRECGTLFTRRLATDLESLLNNILVPNDNSNPSKKNILPLPAIENKNSRCSNIQHLSQLPLKQLRKHDARYHYSNETYSSPWYIKILKPMTIQRYKQISGNFYSFQRPSVSPLRISQSPAVIYYHSVGEDDKYSETIIPLRIPATSQHEHPCFVDGLFSKFRKNKTSTPYKQSGMKRYSNNINNT